MILTLAEALKTAESIQSDFFKYKNLLIATDPAEETDWLMVKTEFSDWECFQPDEPLDNVLNALHR